jgi:hypothetical protein
VIVIYTGASMDGVTLFHRDLCRQFDRGKPTEVPDDIGAELIKRDDFRPAKSKTDTIAKEA